MNSESRRLALAVGFGFQLVTTTRLAAYVANGSWPDGNTTINLQLDGTTDTPALPGGGLSDGSATWNAAVRPAIDSWNAQMTRSKLSPVSASTAPVGRENGHNNVAFSTTVFGEPFGSRTLAVTVTSSLGYTGARLSETDLLFNTAYQWDSYRGSLRSSTQDIRRVALHELGHVLGLDHPDQDDPPQTVTAVMNSTISNIETLQSDDTAGIRVLYGTAVQVPTITRSPQNQSATVGGTAHLGLELNGATAPPDVPTQKYAWVFTPTGGTPEYLFTIHNPEILLGAAQTYDAGAYQVAVETPNGSVASATATVTVNPATPAAATRLINLSTRGFAGTGDRTMIVGFVIKGSRNRRILVRGIGPQLSAYGVAGAMPDPTLSLTTQAGAAIASNDDWDDNGGAASLPPVFTQAGAFALSAGSHDAALVASLPAGSYTAQVIPKTGTAEGVALIEAYDIDDTNDPASRLANLSTRGYVGTDSGVMIAGLVVAGPGPHTFLLRAVGDTLQQYGVSGTLDDPTLELFSVGSTSTLLRETDDWDSPEFLQPLLQQTFTTVGAFTFSDRQESALRLTLNPGMYSLKVAGFHNGTGIALVEVYEVAE